MLLRAVSSDSDLSNIGEQLHRLRGTPKNSSVWARRFSSYVAVLGDSGDLLQLGRALYRTSEKAPIVCAAAREKYVPNQGSAIPSTLQDFTRKFTRAALSQGTVGERSVIPGRRSPYFPSSVFQRHATSACQVLRGRTCDPRQIGRRSSLKASIDAEPCVRDLGSFHTHSVRCGESVQRLWQAERDA
ncbi:hypothetical protein NDU88_005996 [Pleurodeles waltl]|uniref:Uncharacterized protein n=1 Tax=Pleurodeles waltl TaxID=8319 RepID=A0AAV7W9C6_PLEWA|nr:hypothetical protein NDU88_005996 [Pleurodeles waltl]